MLLHYILYIIAYNSYAITMDNLRLLSSGIRLQRDRATPTVYKFYNYKVQIL